MTKIWQIDGFRGPLLEGQPVWNWGFQKQCGGLKWDEDRQRNGERDSEALLVDQGGAIFDIVSDAYLELLEPEVLKARRKACLVRATVQIEADHLGLSRKTGVLAIDEDKSFLSVVTLRLERTGWYEIRSILIPASPMQESDPIVILDVGSPEETRANMGTSSITSAQWSFPSPSASEGVLSGIRRIAVEAEGLLYFGESASPVSLVHCLDQMFESIRSRRI